MKKTGLITQNLEEEFRVARAVRTGVVSPNDLPLRLQRTMKRRAASGITLEKVAEQYYNPFIQTTEIEVPKDRKEKNRWYRFYFANDPIVHSALTLHAQFPFSTFTVQHEDEEISNFFNEMIEDIGLFEFILDMMLEYWIIGEAFPFGFFDNAKDPKTWTDFILINPNYVDVSADPWARGKRKEKIWMTPSESLKKIVDNGPGDEKTGPLYAKIPQDIIDGVKNGKLDLGEVQVSHVKKKGNYHDLRGTSIIENVLKLLMYKDKLRAAQYTIADRHITPSEFYFIGSETDPADEAELESFQDALVSVWTQPNRALIWHHAVKVQWEGATGRMLPLAPEFEEIDNQILTGLMLSRGFLYGEQPTYASASVALDVLIQRYLLDRMRVERWVENNVFAPICKLHELYKPKRAEVRHKIKIEDKDRPLWIPKVSWQKQSLRDFTQKLTIYERLAEKDKIPWSYVLELLDIDPEAVKGKVEKEQREAPLPTAAPPVPVGAPLPVVPPVEQLAGGLPEATPPGSEAIPPEAHREMELPGGI